MSAQREGSPVSAQRAGRPVSVPRRVLVFGALFWAATLGFIALDWAQSAPYNRFDEPLPWALGQPPSHSGAHCSAAPPPRK